jgi:hypothetical protein
MIAISNNELEYLSSVGRTAKCPNCGKMHKVKYGKKVLKDGTKVPTNMLGFVKCGNNSYLVSIEDKLIN